MARPLKKQSLDIIAACREHLMMEGPQDWAAIYRRWPDTPRSTIARLIEVAKQEIEGAAAKNGPEALRLAQVRIRRSIETPETVNKKIRAHLPTAPSPAIVAGLPAESQARVFDFMAYFFNVVNDADPGINLNYTGAETAASPIGAILKAVAEVQAEILGDCE